MVIVVGPTVVVLTAINSSGNNSRDRSGNNSRDNSGSDNSD